jgi:hypothetical protein
MDSRLREFVGLVPLLAAFAIWAPLFLKRKLRVRTMACTVAVGVFLSLCLADLVVLSRPVGEVLSPRQLAVKAAIATVFGATMLTWWPMLGKGLRRIGILW